MARLSSSCLLYKSDEDMTATTIMADSSNIGMSLIAKELTFSKFYEYLPK